PADLAVHHDQHRHEDRAQEHHAQEDQRRQIFSDDDLAVAYGRRVEQVHGAALALGGEQAHGDEDAGEQHRAAREIEELREDLGAALLDAAHGQRVEQQALDEEHGGDDDVAGPG